MHKLTDMFVPINDFLLSFLRVTVLINNCFINNIKITLYAQTLYIDSWLICHISDQIYQLMDMFVLMK